MLILNLSTQEEKRKKEKLCQIQDSNVFLFKFLFFLFHKIYLCELKNCNLY